MSLKLFVRKKKESEAFKKGQVIPYPTLEQYEAEQNELPSYLIFTIKDENGNFIRELRTGHKKGLNKIKWDMRYPAGLSVNSAQASPTSGLPSSNVFVLPGKYSVNLSQNVKGVISELAGPVTFELKELNNRTIPADDREEMAVFKLKTLKLDNAVRAVSGLMGEMNRKIPFYKAATKGFRPEQANDLMNEVLALEKQLMRTIPFCPT